MSAIIMMYILKRKQSVWSEQYRLELTRVPTVGEFIDIHSSEDRPDDNWYKVLMVVHCAFEPECDANIFVQPVNYHEAFPDDGETYEEILGS